MKSRVVLFTFGLLLIASLQFLSAQTPVAGKIYNSNFEGVISGADVTISCGSNTLETTSLTDGTYGVKFDEDECAYPSSVSVKASKGELTGSGSGELIACTGIECTEDYVAVVNIELKFKPSSSGSSSDDVRKKRYYKCGNGVCDTGETANTCSLDCKVVEEEVPEDLTIVAGAEENTQEETSDTTAGTNSGITGAAVGFAKSPAGIGIGVVIVVIAIIVFTAVNRKNELN